MKEGIRKCWQKCTSSPDPPIISIRDDTQVSSGNSVTGNTLLRRPQSKEPGKVMGPGIGKLNKRRPIRKTKHTKKRKSTKKTKHTKKRKPTRKRKQQVPYFVIPFREPRAVKNARVPNVTLKQDLYIGNRAKYAGFAVNAPGQTLLSSKGVPVTYAEHGIGPPKRRLTAEGGKPNWYNIYTKGGFINKDIAMAFKKVGFK